MAQAKPCGRVGRRQGWFALARLNRPHGAATEPPSRRALSGHQPSRLAAIDLDGTLLRSDGTISERSRAAIRASRDKGIVVVIVTARGPASVVDLARDAGIDGSAICSNGGLVVDLATGTIVRERLLETEIAVELVHALRARLPGIVFAVEHEAFAHEHGFSAWDWEPPAGTRVADALELLEDPATKIILRHAGHEVEAVAAVARELAGGRATVVQSGGEAVEVTAIGVNKAAGLAEVAAEHGIGAAEVIAFGDFLNDVPMLAWAGRGVAVANAHAEVLAIADEVTASNDDDGVAIVLEQLAG
jgi:Cof subfamily protein (haloacid dehalogenase superfamily)